MTEIKAQFEEASKRYTFSAGLFVLLGTIIGIPLIPFWVLGFGQWYSAEDLRRKVCVLTDKALKIKKGVFIQSEKNIPLEKITDITVVQGPLLRHFNLYTLKIETAGQSTAGQANEGLLVGIKNAKEFRNHVLKYRDRMSPASSAETLPSDPETQLAVLQEISETLKRIENHITKKS